MLPPRDDIEGHFDSTLLNIFLPFESITFARLLSSGQNLLAETACNKNKLTRVGESLLLLPGHNNQTETTRRFESGKVH